MKCPNFLDRNRGGVDVRWIPAYNACSCGHSSGAEENEMKATKYSFQKIAFVGNYIPRRCGIATFTTDLCESVTREVPDINCVAGARKGTPEGYAYRDQARV